MSILLPLLLYLLIEGVFSASAVYFLSQWHESIDLASNLLAHTLPWLNRIVSGYP
jgi:hypothetical protein